MKALFGIDVERIWRPISRAFVVLVLVSVSIACAKEDAPQPITWSLVEFRNGMLSVEAVVPDEYFPAFQEHDLHIHNILQPAQKSANYDPDLSSFLMYADSYDRSGGRTSFAVSIPLVTFLSPVEYYYEYAIEDVLVCFKTKDTALNSRWNRDQFCREVVPSNPTTGETSNTPPLQLMGWNPQTKQYGADVPLGSPLHIHLQVASNGGDNPIVECEGYLFDLGGRRKTPELKQAFDLVSWASWAVSEVSDAGILYPVKGRDTAGGADIRGHHVYVDPLPEVRTFIFTFELDPSIAPVTPEPIVQGDNIPRCTRADGERVPHLDSPHLVVKWED